MEESTFLPEQLFPGPLNINLYYLHETFRHCAATVSKRIQDERGFDLSLNAGMWGGSYLVADDTGVSKTNVIRLYTIVSLPQNTPLDQPEEFEHFITFYKETFKDFFGRQQLNLVDPKWGEPIPYTNKTKPTVTLQMWDQTKRVHYVRAFFVWNRATWAESIIYDTVRNVKQIKELLNLDHRPAKKSPQEIKFILQDVLIIFFTLRPVLTPDFLEHAQPIIDELFQNFVSGLHGEEKIEDAFQKVYANALVYGYEEALEGHYKKDGLNIFQIEDWPKEKINWVPEELKQTLAPALEAKFKWFRKNLAQKKSN